jgi:NAD(P)-dependent dehydrogenase (short-subunit alcohol dehydrogenase family)
MATVNPFSLAGKTALIAGASRGIGQAMAEAVARAGAKTILAARTVSKLEETAAALRAEGLEASALELDVASKASREKAAAAAGPVDILMLVAGTNIRKRFTDFTREEYDRLMEINLHGLFEFSQLVGKGMIERGKGGKVVIIGSLTTGFGLPYVSVYAITKAALGGMTRSLAAEWGQYDIQVNCIAPGFILTDLNREMWKKEELKAWLKNAQPNTVMGTPADIAPAAVFLASPGARYITGQVLYIDGGFSVTGMWPFQP